MLAFLALMPLASGAALLWEFLLQNLGLPTERQEIVDLFLQSKSPALLGFLVLLALVLAPVAEELVFRLGIFRYLRSRPPIAVVAGAAVAGALLFLVGNGLILLVKGSTANAAGQFVLAAEIGLAAWLLTILPAVRRFLLKATPRWFAFGASAGLFALLHGNWMSALPLFVVGLVLAVSYERTGRIAVPMFAHALFNLNTLLLILSGVSN
jgi:membrane protease YdiL (CAAX protease family)